MRGACFEFAQKRHGLNGAAFDELFQDPSDLRDGAVEILFPQQRRELVLAPHGVLLAQAFDGECELRLGLGFADGVRLNGSDEQCCCRLAGVSLS